MFKACSRCGKLHPINYKCTEGKVYQKGDEYHNTHKWHKKAEAIKKKADYLCEVCKDEGRYTYNNIEVHHIIKIKDNKDLFLEDTNLICLCQFHHRLAEQGGIDADYLRKLSEERESPHEKLRSKISKR